MKRTPLARKTPLSRGTSELKRKTPMKKRNSERLARLEAEQFGEYGDHIATLACIVTGDEQVDRAHVLGTRGAGHGPEGLAPLSRLVHIDFDDGLLNDAAFEKRWGVSRADIRAWAIEHHEEWLAEQEPLTDPYDREPDEDALLAHRYGEGI